jgi:energy-converting hydrogenase Eha subunit E
MLPLVLAVRFLLELVAFAVIGWWGYDAGGMPLAVVGAAAAIAAWALVVSPKARFEPPLPAKVAVEVLVFGVATIALIVLDHRIAAVAFIAAAAVDGVLVRLLPRA